jgi:hypothetical protein
MNPSDDPHLVERLARLAAFHDLPKPVVVQLTLMAAELLQVPAERVHAEIEARVAHARAALTARPNLRLVE